VTVLVAERFWPAVSCLFGCYQFGLGVVFGLLLYCCGISAFVFGLQDVH
jgi:hypothetical protein